MFAWVERWEAWVSSGQHNRQFPSTLRKYMGFLCRSSSFSFSCLDELHARDAICRAVAADPVREDHEGQGAGARERGGLCSEFPLEFGRHSCSEMGPLNDISEELHQRSVFPRRVKE